LEENRGNKLFWTLLHSGNWNLYIAATEKGLTYVSPQNAPFEELVKWANKWLPEQTLVEDAEVMEPYTLDFIEYLEGRLKKFTGPMDLYGTQFQLSVWRVLSEVPYSKTVSYTDIAVRIGKPNAVRAVGGAIGANPILIAIPCHRVIAKSGALTGFRGGLEMKKQLLDIEQ